MNRNLQIILIVVLASVLVLLFMLCAMLDSRVLNFPSQPGGSTAPEETAAPDTTTPPPAETEAPSTASPGFSGSEDMAFPTDTPETAPSATDPSTEATGQDEEVWGAGEIGI